jgi:lipase ATG15
MWVATVTFLFFGIYLTVSTASDTELVFELRHLHAISSAAQVAFANVPRDGFQSLDITHHQYAVKANVVKTYRPPPSVSPLWISDQRRNRARTQQPFLYEQSFPEDHVSWWDEDEILGPDVSQRSTLLLLAKMTNNAYLNPDEKGWYDLGSNWTAVCTRSP